MWSDPAVLLDQLGHAVIATDAAGTVVFWNRAAEEIYGWGAAEALGRPITELTVPQIGQALAGEIMTALRAGNPWSGAFTVRRRDGTRFPALVTDTAVRSSTGEMVGMVGVSLDLARAVEPLLVRSSDAALLLARDDRITLVSPAAARLFGWTGERTLGTRFWELIHPDDLDAAREYYERALAAPDGVRPHECRVSRLADGWSWAEMVFTNLLGDPSAGYVVANVRDVTERHDDREQLAKLAQQLQTALTTRVVIEQAKGIIAHTHAVSVDQAFELLRRHARSHNARLIDVATAVVNLGLQI